MAPDAPERKPRRPRKAPGGGGKEPRRSEQVGPRAKGRTGRGRARSRLASLGRLRKGEAIYLVAAILLFILMFFDWYGMMSKSSGGEPLGGVVTGAGGGSAWQTLELIPLFLMLAIVVAVGSALLRLGKSTWKPAIPPATAVCLLGALAAILILIRIVSPPGPGGAFSELSFESTVKVPVFLALAAALGIAYGGWRAMGEEGTTFGGIAKRLESPERPQRKKPEPKSKPAEAAAKPKPKSSSRAKPKPAGRPKS